MEAATSHEPKTLTDRVSQWVDAIYKIIEIAKAVVIFVKWVWPFIPLG